MSCQCLECQCGFKDIEFNSEEQYLEFMRIQEERLREKNGIAKPEKEFMADLEWIRKNRVYYSYDMGYSNDFDNLRDM